MNLEAMLHFSNFNTRTEKHGSEKKVPASDLKFTGAVSLETVKPLFATEAAFNKVVGQLFRKDGELFCMDVDTISLRTEGVGVTAELTTDLGKSKPIKLSEGTIDKIKLTPKPGKVIELSFRLKCKPTPEQIGQLYEMQDTDMKIKAGGQAQLPLEDDAEEPNADEE